MATCFGLTTEPSAVELKSYKEVVTNTSALDILVLVVVILFSVTKLLTTESQNERILLVVIRLCLSR